MKRNAIDRTNVFSNAVTLKKDQINLREEKDGDVEFVFLPANDDEEKKGEIALWRAVITQALMDAGSKSNKSEMRYNRAQAISWLSGTGPDFNTVCSLAGFEPEYVIKKAREAIKRGCIWRKENIKIKKIITRQNIK